VGSFGNPFGQQIHLSLVVMATPAQHQQCTDRFDFGIGFIRRSVA
jgi:hypothetical protein